MMKGISTMRRVVTGTNTAGKAVFTHIEEIEPFVAPSNIERYDIWGWDELPSLPYLHEGRYVPGEYPVHPPAPGVRVVTTVFPPGWGVDDDGPGRHLTDTVDIAFVLSGEVELEQDDGVVVTLRAGDHLIQNGALHLWRNRGTLPCIVGFVVFGVERRA